LVAAIRSRIREIESLGALQVVLQAEDDTDQWLPEDVSLCLFRFLQEALANVQKHAAARRVVVDLQIAPDNVCVTVQDDGVGFQVPTHLGQFIATRHFGLVGLRERLELVHGSLEVISEPGRGTCLQACIPLAGCEEAPSRKD
jgi:signal transduction histidine kinase